MPLLLAGCAASPEPFVQLSGTSGAVSWQIVDVSQSALAGREIRWDYTLILRSVGGAIQFETLESGSEGGASSVHTSPFTERLEASGRLLIDHSYTLQQSLASPEVFGNSALGELGGPVAGVRRGLVPAGRRTLRPGPLRR
jgi:hypothetical protein